jgi:hypothetical protein
MEIGEQERCVHAHVRGAVLDEVFGDLPRLAERAAVGERHAPREPQGRIGRRRLLRRPRERLATVRPARAGEPMRIQRVATIALEQIEDGVGVARQQEIPKMPPQVRVDRAHVSGRDEEPERLEPRRGARGVGERVHAGFRIRQGACATPSPIVALRICRLPALGSSRVCNRS